jgi:hypothetical protein
MQIIKITHASLMSEVVTVEMVAELALFVGMSAEQIMVASAQVLRGASKSVAQLTVGKLRTMVNKKLCDSIDLGELFKNGELEVEFTCLPDEEVEELDIAKAGKNKSTASGKRSTATGGIGELKGSYTVVTRKGLKCTIDTDPEKTALWDFVWNCNTFEQYFATAPKKAITRTGRIITASSEIRWAVKSGWIKVTA